MSEFPCDLHSVYTCLLFLSFFFPAVSLETCNNLKTTRCLNGGYLRHVVNVSDASLPDTALLDDAVDQVTSLQTSCECDCPPNTRGSHCEMLANQGYYESLHPPFDCGNDTIDQSGHQITIKNQSNIACAWTVKVSNSLKVAGQSFPRSRDFIFPQASEHHVVEVTFHEFKLSPRVDTSVMKGNSLQVVNDDARAGVKSRVGKCALDSLEIRLTDPFDGSFYCGEDIAAASTIRSNSSSVILVLHSFNTYSSDVRVNVSLSFTVSFVSVNDDGSHLKVTTMPSITTSAFTSNFSSTDIDKVNNHGGSNLHFINSILQALWTISLNSFFSFISTLRDQLPTTSTVSQWG